MARLKIRRKDLRRPDEFMEFTGRAWQWVQDHRTGVIGVAVGVVVLVAAVTAAQQYEQYRERSAAEAFRKAAQLLAGGDSHSAASAFANVPRIGMYGGLADLYRGHAALKGGELTEAVEAFRAAASQSELPSYVRQAALYGLALSRERQGDEGEAVARYEEAAELAGPFTLDARLGAAGLSQAAGDSAKARGLYELALADAENSGLVQDDLRKVAQWHLAELSAGELGAEETPAE